MSAPAEAPTREEAKIWAESVSVLTGHLVRHFRPAWRGDRVIALNPAPLGALAESVAPPAQAW